MKTLTQISQAQIARELGISPARLCQILTGADPLPYKLAYQWSKTMGRPMDWFLNASPVQLKSFLFKQFDGQETTV